MSFSWGGFARTLNDNIIKNQDARRDEESYNRRKKMEMELEKQYGAEVVARTAIEGNQEISYNKYGDRIGAPRNLTAEELTLRNAERDKTLADARLSTFNADFADDKFRLDELSTQAAIRANDAQSRRADAGMSLDQQKFNWETGGGKGLPRDVQEDLSEVRTMIAAVPPDGINSPQARMNKLNAEIGAAQAAGDIETVRRIIAEVKGEILIPFTSQKSQATGGNTGWSALPAPRSLDGSE